MFILRIALVIAAVALIYYFKTKRTKNETGLSEKTTRIKSLFKSIGLVAVVKVCAIALVMVILVLFYRG